MRVLKEFLSGSRKAHGISNTAAILIALVVLFLGGFLIKRLVWAAFVLLHWAFKIAVLIALILLVAYVIKYLAKKME